MGEVADPDDPPFAPSRTGDSLYVYGGRAIETCTESKRTYWTVMYMYKATIELELSFIT